MNQVEEMKVRYRSKSVVLFIIIMLISGFSGVFAQKGGFTDSSRAIFIMDISKSIFWPSSVALPEFTIGVLGKDATLVEALEHEAAKRTSIHNKPIKIVAFNDIPEIAKVHTIFVNKKNGTDIDSVLHFVQGKNILVISENYEFHKSMVNFIVVKNRQKFEANEKRLLDAGFKVPDNFLVLAVKTKADWEKLYEQTEFLLKKEQEIVRTQNIEIQKQIEQINTQKNLIAQQYQEIELQKNQLAALSEDIEIKKKELITKMAILLKQEGYIKKQENDIATKQAQITEFNKELEDKQIEITAQTNKISEQKAVLKLQLDEIQKQRLIIYLAIGMLLLVTVLGYFIYKAYKIKRQANIILAEKNREISLQNEEIKQQKEEIEAQRDEIEKHRDELIIKNEEILQQKEEIIAQRDEIEKQRDIATAQRDEIAHQKKQILDSINYAKRIQQAILPVPELLNEIFKQFFILFKPKDIVSGDFYWASKIDHQVIIAAVDCTGHGVPGAFMSMLGVTYLTKIINEEGVTTPSKILDRLRDYIVMSLKQKGITGEVKEGMDMALCTFDYETNVLQYAGAMNPMVLIKNDEMCLIKGDNMPVAISLDMAPFNNNTFELNRGDSFYVFSDGFADQFGGPKNRKFMSKNFREKIFEIRHETMLNQKKLLDQTFEDWKGSGDQIDDVLVIGVKV